MKQLVLLAGVATAALSAGAHAGDIYLQVHGGFFQQTEDSIELAGQVALQDLSGIDGTTDADLGFAAGGLVGAYILPFIALEGEVTMRTANVDDISVDGISAAIDDDLRTIAYMGNVVFRPEINLPLLPMPYIGVGAGWLSSNLETVNGEDADGQFAYQVKAGVVFDLLPTPGKLGLEVNYLMTDDFDLGGTIDTDDITANYAYGGVTGLVTWKVGF